MKREPLPPRRLLQRALAEPWRAIMLLIALARGQWYRFYYPMRGLDFRVGRGFRAFGRLRLKGPGTVVFGNNVVIWERVTPWTYSSSALIEIGDNTQLAGTRFGAAESISIGRDCIVADVRILDTDFHSTRADRRWSAEAPVRIAPVRVGDNVWISAASALLPGTEIGENSVVGFGSVCVRSYPGDVVIMGNPARVASPVPPLEAQPATAPIQAVEVLTG